MGFFVVVATFPIASARAPHFFATFAEQAESADSGALNKPLINEPVNELILDEPFPVKKANQKNKGVSMQSEYFIPDLVRTSRNLAILRLL